MQIKSNNAKQKYNIYPSLKSLVLTEVIRLKKKWLHVFCLLKSGSVIIKMGIKEYFIAKAYVLQIENLQSI